MPRPLAQILVAVAAVLLVSGSAEAQNKKKKPRSGSGPATEGAIAGEVSRMTCRSPDEVKPDLEILVECDFESWLEDARIELFYRPAGNDGYTSIPMAVAPPPPPPAPVKGKPPRSAKPAAKGPLQARVPAAQVRPPFVLYYIQASVADAGVVAAAGRHDSPSVVRVKAPDPAPVVAAAPVWGSKPSGPVSTVDRLAAFATGQARAPGSFWAGLAMGSGYGWQPSTRLEYRSDLEAGSGFGPAGLAHLAPEVGYQLTPQIAVALAGRHQFISGGGGEPAYPGEPAHWAHALLVRGLYGVDRGPFAFHGAFQVGGGSGFRFRFGPDPVSGRPRHDTTRGGPVVLGPGVGILYRLRPKLSLVAETNLLFGVPDFALMTDVNLGVQVNL